MLSQLKKLLTTITTAASLLKAETVWTTEKLTQSITQVALYAVCSHALHFH